MTFNAKEICDSHSESITESISKNDRIEELKNCLNDFSILNNYISAAKKQQLTQNEEE